MATQKTRQVKFLAFLILFSKIQKPIPIKTWHDCPNKTSSPKTALQCEDRASPCSAACVGLHWGLAGGRELTICFSKLPVEKENIRRKTLYYSAILPFPLNYSKFPKEKCILKFTRGHRTGTHPFSGTATALLLAGERMFSELKPLGTLNRWALTPRPDVHMLLDYPMPDARQVLPEITLSIASFPTLWLSE